MKLTYPLRNWAALRWAAYAPLPESVTTAIRTLSDMPGVRGTSMSSEYYLEIPRNLWHVDAFRVAAAYAASSTSASRSARPMWTSVWTPKEPLYAHQREAVDFLVANEGGLLADTMGLGKTRSAIVAAMSLGDEEPSLPKLILGPKYTRDVWARELRAVGAVTSDDEFFVCQGHSTSPIPRQARWIFCHYDVVLAWQTRIGYAHPIVAILDEAHWVKNGRAKRSQGASVAAGVARYRILLTGTPMPNRPAELWWPLTILDGPHSWGSPRDFRIRYCGAIHNGYGLEDTAPTHTDELRERLQRRYLRRTLDDANVELPAFTRRKLEVTLDEADFEKYKTLVSDFGHQKLLEAVLSRRAGTDTITAITSLRKLASKAKLSATVDFVRDVLEQGESVVVFTWMRDGVASILKPFKKTEHTVTDIHGGYSQEERDRRVAQFQQNGGALVATFDSLKEGVTLTRARFVLLHDMAWVPSDMLQAEARVYRIGQDKPVQAVWVLAKDTIDILLASTLAVKANDQHAMLGLVQAQEAAADLGLASLGAGLSAAEDVDRLVEEWMRRSV